MNFVGWHINGKWEMKRFLEQNKIVENLAEKQKTLQILTKRVSFD